MGDGIVGAEVSPAVSREQAQLGQGVAEGPYQLSMGTSEKALGTEGTLQLRAAARRRASRARVSSSSGWKVPSPMPERMP